MASPWAIVSIASVIMNDGMPIQATQKPLKYPIAAPTRRATGMLQYPRSDHVPTQNHAARTPTKTESVPMERSISAHKMTNVAPAAAIAIGAVWERMFCRLTRDRKRSVVRLKKTTKVISVTIGARRRAFRLAHLRARFHVGWPCRRLAITDPLSCAMITAQR